jgi:hypothetical protein
MYSFVYKLISSNLVLMSKHSVNVLFGLLNVKYWTDSHLSNSFSIKPTFVSEQGGLNEHKRRQKSFPIKWTCLWGFFILENSSNVETFNLFNEDIICCFFDGILLNFLSNA